MSKYQRWYDQIIWRAKNRQLDCYCEIHHIVPKAFNGSDEDSNLVRLTYREHFLAHWLLTKIYNEGRGRRAMVYALMMMGTIGLGDRLITSWQYDVAKRAMKLHVLERKRKLKYEPRVDQELRLKNQEENRYTKWHNKEISKLDITNTRHQDKLKSAAALLLSPIRGKKMHVPLTEKQLRHPKFNKLN